VGQRWAVHGRTGSGPALAVASGPNTKLSQRPPPKAAPCRATRQGTDQPIGARTSEVVGRPSPVRAGRWLHPVHGADGQPQGGAERYAHPTIDLESNTSNAVGVTSTQRHDLGLNEDPPPGRPPPWHRRALDSAYRAVGRFADEGPLPGRGMGSGGSAASRRVRGLALSRSSRGECLRRPALIV
jgi:hypothetical protein